VAGHIQEPRAQEELLVRQKEESDVAVTFDVGDDRGTAAVGDGHTEVPLAVLPEGGDSSSSLHLDHPMDLGGIHYLEVEVHMDLEDVTESSVMWLGAS
jgi:hypothetical protein